MVVFVAMTMLTLARDSLTNASRMNLDYCTSGRLANLPVPSPGIPNAYKNH